MKNSQQVSQAKTDTYRILKQVVNTDEDIEDAVLRTIIDKIRQESGIAADVPADRLVDLSVLREAKAELKKTGPVVHPLLPF